MRLSYPARPLVAPAGHTQILLDVLTRAIRAASMAPSDREAFDIAGAALLRAADLVKAEAKRCSEGIFTL